MDTVFPEFLNSHDSIEAFAPAGPMQKEEFNVGIEQLEKLFTVLFDESVLNKKGYLAGDDEQRVANINRVLSCSKSSAIIAARGGYGTSRLLDIIDYSKYIKCPKWIVGSSDLTALLLFLWSKFHIATIHGPMVKGFDQKVEEDKSQLLNLLKGKQVPSVKLKTLIAGEADGPIIGGNLTVLSHMCGTVDSKYSDGCILFLEDTNEPLYKLDRCFVQLCRSGVLNNIKGIILGEFTNSDTQGFECLVKDFAKKRGIPVAGDYPAAHGKRNLAFIHGGCVRLSRESELFFC